MQGIEVAVHGRDEQLRCRFRRVGGRVVQAAAGKLTRDHTGCADLARRGGVVGLVCVQRKRALALYQRARRPA